MLNSLLNQIIKSSITQRWLIVIGAILITLWGVFNITQMPLDVFPEFAPPQVDIQTEAPGLAPEEIEAQITVPIESAVNGLPGVTTVRSSSKIGLSMVQVVFDQNADMPEPFVRRILLILPFVMLVVLSFKALSSFR